MPEPKLLAGAINHLRKCRHGYMLYNVNDVYVGRSFELYGEFSQGEAELFEQIVRPGDTVLDIGANIGAHTVVLANRVGPTGTVYAFEPQRLVFQTLCANIALNSLINTHCLQVALGEAPGSVTVPVFNYAQVNNYGGVSMDMFETGEKVPAITLDSLELPACRFIKLDVEGMEIKALQGAVRTIERLQPILYVEDDRLEKSEALRQFIDSLDYDMYWHLPTLYNGRNYLQNPQNVFGNVVSVNLLCVSRKSETKIKGFDRALPTQEHPLAAALAASGAG